MKTRIIQTRFWDDEFVLNLSLRNKLLFLFYITNSKIGLTGAYEMSDRLVTFSTGLTSKEIQEAKEIFKQKIVFIKSWVILLNAYKYNNYASNDKLRMAYMKEYSLLPDFVQPYIETYEVQDYKPDYIKSGGVSLHRKVAEGLLGRKLNSDEIVHHIDKNPSNNNPDNLAVMENSVHIQLHKGEIDLNDTRVILVSDLYDTNYKSKNKNYKSKTINQKTKTKKEGDNTELSDILSHFNQTFEKNFTSKGFLDNFVLWRKEYSVDQIKQAITNWKNNGWFIPEGQERPDILFRTKNKNGQCDYIGDLLNSKRKSLVI